MLEEYAEFIECYSQYILYDEAYMRIDWELIQQSCLSLFAYSFVYALFTG